MKPVWSATLTAAPAPRRGFYAPTRDPDGSRALVAYMCPPPNERDGHVEVLAAEGSGWTSEEEAIGPTEMAANLASWLDEQADGLYVLYLKHAGHYDDVTFDVWDVRSLDDEERAHVLANTGYEGVRVHWLCTIWAQVPCDECGALPGAHIGLDCTCPTTEARDG